MTLNCLNNLSEQLHCCHKQTPFPLHIPGEQRGINGPEQAGHQVSCWTALGAQVSTTPELSLIPDKPQLPASGGAAVLGRPATKPGFPGARGQQTEVATSPAVRTAWWGSLGDNLLCSLCVHTANSQVGGGKQQRLCHVQEQRNRGATSFFPESAPSEADGTPSGSSSPFFGPPPARCSDSPGALRGWGGPRPRRSAPCQLRAPPGAPALYSLPSASRSSGKRFFRGDARRRERKCGWRGGGSLGGGRGGRGGGCAPEQPSRAGYRLPSGSNFPQQPRVRPPRAAQAAAAAGSTPPGGARRAAATQRGAGLAGSAAGGHGDSRGGGGGESGSRQDAGCGGPDTSWKLLEMAPALAPEGAANLGRALAPAGLLSRTRMEGPEALSLRSAFLHGSFVSPERPFASPELPHSPSPALLPEPRRVIFLGGLHGLRCPDKSEFRIVLTSLLPVFSPEADSQLLHSWTGGRGPGLSPREGRALPACGL
ncbi:hypothetical protein Cadr_000028589 [Camelus dromedarius]|uniref:Uncharacterized protein n=1 Tax=Camelus dromedarius TaxID=9838 RepID=A0A5N4CHH1_CAMDR|nr:hypothetical protein Cadr_000028589 [Camelus dromedarius]